MTLSLWDLNAMAACYTKNRSYKSRQEQYIKQTSNPKIFHYYIYLLPDKLRIVQTWRDVESSQKVSWKNYRLWYWYANDWLQYKSEKCHNYCIKEIEFDIWKNDDIRFELDYNNIYDDRKLWKRWFVPVDWTALDWLKCDIEWENFLVEIRAWLHAWSRLVWFAAPNWRWWVSWTSWRVSDFNNWHCSLYIKNKETWEEYWDNDQDKNSICLGNYLNNEIKEHTEYDDWEEYTTEYYEWDRYDIKPSLWYTLDLPTRWWCVEKTWYYIIE